MTRFNLKEKVRSSGGPIFRDMKPKDECVCGFKYPLNAPRCPKCKEPNPDYVSPDVYFSVPFSHKKKDLDDEEGGQGVQHMDQNKR